MLLIFVALGIAQSLWLPLGQAPDEIDHFLYTRFIAGHGRLPLSYAERNQAGRKAYLPALYHSLAAVLTGWSNSEAPPKLKVIRESPRVDLLRALYHVDHLLNTADELPPYRGVVLMWRLGRGVSILIAAGVVLIAFLTSLEIFPGNYRLAVIAAALLAFIPSFIFISSTVSYESLSALLIGLYFLLLIRVIKGDRRGRNYAGLGLLMGLSVTVKYVSVILPLQVIAVLAYLAWREGWGWGLWLKQVSLVGLAAIIGSSWWFLFLMVQFNEVSTLGPVVGLLKPIIAGGTDTTQNYIASMLTGGQIGAAGEISRPSFWSWVARTFQSFWVEQLELYSVAPVLQGLFALLVLLTITGLIKSWQRQTEQRLWVGLLSFHFFLFMLFPFLRFWFQGELAHTAQGRHILFPVATAFPALMILGWQAWFTSKGVQRLALATMGALLVWSMAQLGYVRSYYPPPLPVRTTSEAMAQIPNRLDKQFGPKVVLLGYQTQLLPEMNRLRVELYWQGVGFIEEDYRLTFELAQAGSSHLQWMAYLADGRYPSRVWEAGEIVYDNFEFPLSELPAGVHQLHLQVQGEGGPLSADGLERLALGEVTVPAVAVARPEVPLSIKIGDREVVAGFSLWRVPYRKLGMPEYRPGMTIPFLWQGAPAAAEKVTWLLVNDQGQVFSAQAVANQFEYFTVKPDWLPGMYHFRVEVWQNDEVVASEETPPVLAIFNKHPRQVEPPPLANQLNANFANQIGLLGYEVPRRALMPGQSLPVTLYWQALRTMGRNYTFFVKLLDDQQQTWASLDRFARDGYKTSHWAEHEVVTDQFELPISPDTPPGIYWLNVGAYFGINQTAISLPLIVGGEPAEATSVTFQPVKIGGPPPGVVVDDAPPIPAHPVNTTLGEVINLSGYDIAQETQALSINFYWQSVAPADMDYTVFVHVKDQSGQILAQMDRLPVAGAYPTSVWSPGEIILDTMQIPLPAQLPSGQYSIFVGMYDFFTGNRLPVRDSSDNSILLTTLNVP